MLEIELDVVLRNPACELNTGGPPGAIGKSKLRTPKPNMTSRGVQQTLFKHAPTRKCMSVTSLLQEVEPNVHMTMQAAHKLTNSA